MKNGQNAVGCEEARGALNEGGIEMHGIGQEDIEIRIKVRRSGGRRFDRRRA